MKLKDHDIFYWRAFHELTGSRPVGENFGPIPVQAVLAYFEMFHIRAACERDGIWKRIRKLDEEYVSYTLKKRQQELDRHQLKQKGR